MTPIGGTKKPPHIRPTDTKKQIANVMRDIRNVRGSSALSDFRVFEISIFTELSNFIIRAKTGLGFTMSLFGIVSFKGKSPMADESFANEVYNMPYAKGHRAEY